MNCWHCDRPAHGSCNFCGRAICKEHAKFMPGLVSIFRDRGGILRGLVVDTTLHCGVCNPKRYPVNLEAVDPAPLNERLGVEPMGLARGADSTRVAERSAMPTEPT